MSSTRPIGRRSVLAGASALSVVAMAGGARAQSWRPTKQVRIVVPAAPGGTTDVAGRLLADHLTKKWGQTVVVDNKSGAGGIVGSAEVARAAPDGHTILMGNIGPQSIAYSLYRNMPYQQAQLVPVSNMILTPNVLVVHPSVPAKTVPEFVAWLKAQDGKVSYASAGTGQSPHLCGAWFLQLTGAKATHVPYRGAAPALNDLIAGVTQYYFDNLSSSIEFVRAGKLNALGLTSAARNPNTPELVPIRETMPELKDFDVSAWFGVFLPGGSPKPIVDALNIEIKELLESEPMQARLKQMAGFGAWTPPEQFATFIDKQVAQWKGVIDKEGLKLDVN